MYNDKHFNATEFNSEEPVFDPATNNTGKETTSWLPNTLPFQTEWIALT